MDTEETNLRSVATEGAGFHSDSIFNNIPIKIWWKFPQIRQCDIQTQEAFRRSAGLAPKRARLKTENVLDYMVHSAQEVETARSLSRPARVTQ